MNPLTRLHPTLLLVAGLALAAARGAGAERPAAPVERLGDGVVVWESNRSGAFRIVARELRAPGARQLSPDEPGRDHCCAALSPDGGSVAYLSLPKGQAGYFDGRATGELRLLALDGGPARRLAPAARTYAEHRAVVWWSARELVYIDGAGVTRRLDVVTGDAAALTPTGRAEFGWLIDPTGRFATTGDPTFSRVGEDGEILPAPRLGGCQPVFSGDGRYGVWSAGAGGPIARLELATRRVGTLLRRNDPRVPDGFGYLYFPNPSRDGAALAFAASRGEHDHFTADYEVFVVPTDPATLEPLAAAVQISRHPAVDRFPDVWLAAPSRAAGATPTPASPPAAAHDGAWPVSRAGLALLWPDGDRYGAVTDGGRLVERGDLLAAEGRAWLDGRGRMALAGGRFTLDPALAGQVDDALQGANELTLELEVEPWSVEPGPRGPVLALANAPGSRSFALLQEGERLLLVLRTSDTERSGGAPVEIARLAAGRASHVAVTFSPGRLSTWVDGERTVDELLVPGDFFHWNAVHLAFGGEERGDARWRGWLAGVRLAARAAEAAEAVAAHAAWQRDRAERRLPARRRVEGRLTAVSPPPRLESIAPYREALVLQEIDVAAAGGAPAGRLRVARWGLLGGEPMPAGRDTVGERVTLLLEPFTGNARAESLYLADALPEDLAAPILLDVGLDVGLVPVAPAIPATSADTATAPP